MVGPAFDFSEAIQCLEIPLEILLKDQQKSAASGGRTLFHSRGRQSFDACTPLRECLHDMHEHNTRACLVFFPDGVPAARRSAKPRAGSSSAGDKDVEHSTSHTCKAPCRDPVVQLVPPPPPPTNKADTASKDVMSLDSSHHFVSSASDERNDTSNGTGDERILNHYLLLDMRDVVALLVERHTTMLSSCSEKGQKASRISTEHVLESILQTPLAEVANVSRRNALQYSTDKETLRELLRKLETTSVIPVFTKSETSTPQFLSLFFVSDFLKFLQDVAPLGGPKKSATVNLTSPGASSAFQRNKSLTPLDTYTAGQIKPVSRSGIAHSWDRIHVCFEDETLLDGLKLLFRTGLSAVPIVSHANPRQCISVFSATDLELLLLRRTELPLTARDPFAVSVLEYVSAVYQLESLKARYPVIHVPQNTTINSVFRKIVASNIRRLLLTDQAGLLTDVLSVTDLGRFIAREFAGKH